MSPALKSTGGGGEGVSLCAKISGVPLGVDP